MVEENDKDPGNDEDPDNGNDQDLEDTDPVRGRGAPTHEDPGVQS